MEELIALAILKEIMEKDNSDLLDTTEEEEHNDHYERCKAIENVLHQYGIDSLVTRSHVGMQNFYNIEMDFRTCDVPVNLFLRHLFDIDEVGLVSLFDNMIVILIDENALHCKYLKGDRFDFSRLDPNAMETFDFIEGIKRDMSLMT